VAGNIDSKSDPPEEWEIIRDETIERLLTVSGQRPTE